MLKKIVYSSLMFVSVSAVAWPAFLESGIDVNSEIVCKGTGNPNFSVTVRLGKDLPHPFSAMRLNAGTIIGNLPFRLETSFPVVEIHHNASVIFIVEPKEVAPNLRRFELEFMIDPKTKTGGFSATERRSELPSCAYCIDATPLTCTGLGRP
mgnify:CR=1 FL=1